MARARGEPVSSYRFTDDEEELRDRAWRFLMPAHERAWFEQHISELVRTRVLPVVAHPDDRTSYHRALTGQAFRSPASRYRRLSEDVEADMLLLGPFAEVAARVIAADRARLRSLSFVREIEEREIQEAAARVAENRCLIAWVRAEVHERSQAYRYALEHVFIEMPQHQAGPAERVIVALENHRRVLDRLPVPPLGNGACGVPAAGPRFIPKTALIVAKG